MGTSERLEPNDAWVQTALFALCAVFWCGVPARWGCTQDEVRVEEQVLPDILECLADLGPQMLTPEHQATVKAMVGRLHELGDFAYSTIYGELTAAFHVGKYSDIPDAEGSHVAEWLQRRLVAAGRKPR